MALEISREDAAGRERAAMADKSGTVAGERLFETVDGKLVRDGDPRGAFLAYGPNDPIKPHHRDAYKELTGDKPTGAAKAYADADAFEQMSRVQAKPEPREVRDGPVLMSDRLATELADRARSLANQPVEVRAEALANASTDDDAVFTTYAVFATEDGQELVHESDPRAVSQKYAAGDRIDPGDVDRYKELGEPPAENGDTGEKNAEQPANKAGAQPANKAATTTVRRR